MTEEVFPRGTVICERWQVEAKIGKGSFGEVYKCKDKCTNKLVALKIARKTALNQEPLYLQREAKVLKAVQGKKFFPHYFSHHQVLTFEFIVMELLGPNLKCIRKSLPRKRFSVDSILFMGCMMLKSIEWLHESGFLHRDIKPANFVIGVAEKIKTVYLIDFGLSKQYVADDGELCSHRNKTCFIGTPYYASAHVLHRKQPGFRDDLISLFYTLIELSGVKPPWKKITCHKELAQRKETCDLSSLIADFPLAFKNFFQHVNTLGLEKPDYGLLLSILESCLSTLARNAMVNKGSPVKCS